MMNYLNIIGEKLKTLRKTNQLTQAELAEKVGIDYRNYQDIESGKTNFKIETLEKILNYFNTSVAALLSHLHLPNNSSFLQKIGALDHPGSATDFAGEFEKWDEVALPAMATTMEGTIIYANKTFSDLVKIPKESLVNNMHFWDVFSGDDAAYAKTCISAIFDSRLTPKPLFGIRSLRSEKNPSMLMVEWTYLKDTNGYLGFFGIFNNIPFNQTL